MSSTDVFYKRRNEIAEQITEFFKIIKDPDPNKYIDQEEFADFIKKVYDLVGDVNQALITRFGEGNYQSLSFVQKLNKLKTEPAISNAESDTGGTGGPIPDLIRITANTERKLNELLEDINFENNLPQNRIEELKTLQGNIRKLIGTFSKIRKITNVEQLSNQVNSIEKQSKTFEEEYTKLKNLAAKRRNLGVANGSSRNSIRSAINSFITKNPGRGYENVNFENIIKAAESAEAKKKANKEAADAEAAAKAELITQLQTLTINDKSLNLTQDQLNKLKRDFVNKRAELIQNINTKNLSSAQGQYEQLKKEYDKYITLSEIRGKYNEPQPGLNKTSVRQQIRSEISGINGITITDFNDIINSYPNPTEPPPPNPDPTPDPKPIPPEPEPEPKPKPIPPEPEPEPDPKPEPDPEPEPKPIPPKPEPGPDIPVPQPPIPGPYELNKELLNRLSTLFKEINEKNIPKSSLGAFIEAKRNINHIKSKGEAPSPKDLKQLMYQLSADSKKFKEQSDKIIELRATIQAYNNLNQLKNTEITKLFGRGATGLGITKENLQNVISKKKQELSQESSKKIRQLPKVIAATANLQKPLVNNILAGEKDNELNTLQKKYTQEGALKTAVEKRISAIEQEATTTKNLIRLEKLSKINVVKNKAIARLIELGKKDKNLNTILKNKESPEEVKTAVQKRKKAIEEITKKFGGKLKTDLKQAVQKRADENREITTMITDIKGTKSLKNLEPYEINKRPRITEAVKKQKEILAATKIQTAVRGKKIRKNFSNRVRTKQLLENQRRKQEEEEAVRNTREELRKLASQLGPTAFKVNINKANTINKLTSLRGKITIAIAKKLTKNARQTFPVLPETLEKFSQSNPASITIEEIELIKKQIELLKKFKTNVEKLTNPRNINYKFATARMESLQKLGGGLNSALKQIANTKKELLDKSAATKIQAGFRGMRNRQLVKKKQEAATKIQAAFRGRRNRQLVKKKQEAATKIQAAFRGRRNRQRAVKAFKKPEEVPLALQPKKNQGLQQSSNPEKISEKLKKLQTALGPGTPELTTETYKTQFKLFSKKGHPNKGGNEMKFAGISSLKQEINALLENGEALEQSSGPPLAIKAPETPSTKNPPKIVSAKIQAVKAFKKPREVPESSSSPLAPPPPPQAAVSGKLANNLGKIKSATKIQAGFRGMRNRQLVKKKQEAATKIQAGFRGMKNRKLANNLRKIKNAKKLNNLKNYNQNKRPDVIKARNLKKKEIEATTKVQARFRGKQAREKLRGTVQTIIEQEKQRINNLIVELKNLIKTRPGVKQISIETQIGNARGGPGKAINIIKQIQEIYEQSKYGQRELENIDFSAFAEGSRILTDKTLLMQPKPKSYRNALTSQPLPKLPNGRTTTEQAYEAQRAAAGVARAGRRGEGGKKPTRNPQEVYTQQQSPTGRPGSAQTPRRNPVVTVGRPASAQTPRRNPVVTVGRAGSAQTPRRNPVVTVGRQQPGSARRKSRGKGPPRR